MWRGAGRAGACQASRPRRNRGTPGADAPRTRWGVASRVAPHAGGALFVASLLAACAPDASDAGLLPRAERYGIFRDLILLPRPAEAGGPFFLDRFETSVVDLEAFHAEQARARGLPVRPPVDRDAGRLPATGLDLEAARAYAGWRFGRLPRQDEWRHAATGGGQYRYPWGDRPLATWSNTGDLGLGRATPVGTFESGRQSGGPYDLIGNVAEWTGSVDLGQALEGLGLLQARSHPALVVLAPAEMPLPALWYVAADREHVWHLVVGAHYLAVGLFDPFTRVDVDAFPLVWPRLPGERGGTTGVRVAADPEGLVRALLSERLAPTAAEEAALRRFLRRGEVRQVLRRAFLRVVPGMAGPGPLLAILQEDLDA